VSRRVRYHEDFRADLRSHVRWVRRERGSDYLARFRRGLEEAVRLVGESPEAGTIEDRRGSAVLRRLLLRDLPYVVWYIVEDGHDEVWLVRLFHARQDRPVR
jgi:plasmid stabilization system protein ParE